MGFAVPAAMGAKVGLPDTTVWAIDGDGCFQMTNQELATCADRGHPDQGRGDQRRHLGMVRQWQTLFYNERYSNTDLHDKRRIPDLVASWPRRYGCSGPALQTRPRERRLDATIAKAMEINDARWSWTSECTATRWSGRWSPPARATTTSRWPATWRPSLRRHACWPEDPDEQAHPLRPRREQARRARPRSPACSAAAGSTSTPSRSARPSTPRSPG